MPPHPTDAPPPCPCAWQEGRRLLDQLDSHPFRPEDSPPGSLITTKYASSVLRLTKLVFLRQVKLNKREKAFYIARAVQVGALCVVWCGVGWELLRGLAPPSPTASASHGGPMHGYRQLSVHPACGRLEVEAVDPRPAACPLPSPACRPPS